MATRPPRSEILATIDRRRFLQLTAGVAATLGLSQLPAGVVRAARPPGAYPFTLGVASGDPAADGVVLWTRLAPSPLEHAGGMPPGPGRGGLGGRLDGSMSSVVASGTAVALRELAHSVHVEVQGLQPWSEYFYRFRAGDHVSPVGRTKTTPAAGSPLDALTFAFASCQDWPAGFYSAYHRMAEEDLDVIVHLGDYIYEYGIGSTGGARNVSVPGQFRTETQRLSEYRIRYALYRTDPDLQEVASAVPVDRDVGRPRGGERLRGRRPGESTPPARFLARRAAAYQAYYEHLPLRLVVDAGRPERAAVSAGDVRRPRRVQRPRHAAVPERSTRAVGGNSRDATWRSIPRPR